MDAYFLNGLPMLGVVGDLVLVLSQGDTLEELCDRNCYATVYVCGSHILMCDIEDLLTQVVGIPRCPKLLVRHGDRLVCMCDVFMFIFIHSVVELVDDYMYRLMVSLLMYADGGSRPSPKYQRRVVTIVEATVLVGNPRR